MPVMELTPERDSGYEKRDIDMKGSFGLWS